MLNVSCKFVEFKIKCVLKVSFGEFWCLVAPKENYINTLNKVLKVYVKQKLHPIYVICWSKFLNLAAILENLGILNFVYLDWKRYPTTPHLKFSVKRIVNKGSVKNDHLVYFISLQVTTISSGASNPKPFPNHKTRTLAPYQKPISLP